MQITCSTIDRTLDLILKPGTHMRRLAYGKKKKSKAQQISNSNSSMISGESAVGLLSSLLDILTLKKDIVDRSSDHL